MPTIISTKAAPAAIGPYSQAVQAGNTLYLSGQIALDPQTGRMVEGDFDAQVHRAIRNVKAVVEAAGGNLRHHAIGEPGHGRQAGFVLVAQRQVQQQVVAAAQPQLVKALVQCVQRVTRGRRLLRSRTARRAARPPPRPSTAPGTVPGSRPA